MDMTDAPDPLQKLEAANKIAIADLDPSLSEPATRVVRGVVTITWPYNSVKNTFAFILAEPDFRLRRNKGQVRINFSGPVARIAAKSGLGSDDEVLLSLEGAEWEAEEAKKRQSLPGASLDWQLSFSSNILLRVKSSETGEARLVTIRDASPDAPPDGPPDAAPTEPQQPRQIELPPIETTHTDSPPHFNFATLTPAKNTRVATLSEGEFASPAFLKRSRMSYGSLFEGGFDIFEEGEARSRGRKRSKFGRDSSAWRYTSQSPSPEPEVPSHGDVASEDEEQPSSPARPRTADEGCQTMERGTPDPEPMLIDTTSNEPEATGLRREHVPEEDSTSHSREVVVDHDIQANPQDGWKPAPSQAMPSLVDSGIVPDTSSNSNAFQSNPQIDPTVNSFGPTWDSRPVELTSEGYPGAPFVAQHPIEVFQPGSLVFQTDQPFSFNAPSLGNHTHSPNRTSEHDSYSAGSVQPEMDQEPLDEEGDQRIETGPVVHYPPLDVAHEVDARPIRDDALSDYPSSYLDETRHSSQGIDMEQTPFNQGFQAVTSVVPSSWATVNNPPRATAVPPIDPLGNTEGSTPDQAVMIDESDSDDSSAPAPMSVDDTVVEGHADALDMYEDANAEDGIDAQYSDDDEPEYDADEMGGDYDTRNYTGPNDDEDDSHDEDMQSRELDLEFEDEESYDEEDEDEENLEYESEYELDFDEPQQTPQHVVQSTPTVIDLISSSEDEGEEEDNGHMSSLAVPPKPASGNLPQHQQQALPNNLPKQSSSYGLPSEIGEGKSSNQLVESNSEDSSDDEEAGSELEEEEIPFQFEVEDEESGGEDEEDENDEENGEESSSDEVSEHVPEEFEETEPVSISMDQPMSLRQHSPKPGFQNNDSENATQYPKTSENEEDVMQLDANHDSLVVAPLSAADGLEILSRVVENESSNQGHAKSSEAIDHTIVDTPFSNAKEAPLVDVQAYDREHSEDAEVISYQVNEDEDKDESEDESEDNEDEYDDSEDDDEENESSDAEVPSNVNMERLAPEKSVIPSSPPPTQPISSHTADGLMESLVQNPSFVFKAQELKDQLPTPAGTQLTNVASSRGPPENSTEINVSQETISVELIDDKVEEITITAEQAISTNEYPTLTEISQGPLDDAGQVEQQPPEIELGREIEPIHSPVPPPSPSLRIRINNTDISFEDIPSPTNGLNVEIRDNTGVMAPDISLSFQSQMEIDEELQASILENSMDSIKWPEQAGVYESSDDQLQDQSQTSSDESDFDTAVDEMDIEQPETGDKKVGSPSPILGRTPMKQPATAAGFSSPQQDFFESHVDTPDDATDTSSQIDPSIQLARAANASKRSTRRREATSDISRPTTRSSNTHESPTLDVEDSSVQLARAFTKPTRLEEDSSMTATKLNLVRHVRDELPDCTSLKVLRQHLTKTLDVIAVAMMKPPEPQRGKSGPREYMMSFTITDHSIGPFSVAEVQLYRPHKDTLPQVKPGDVVLLRNFKVMSLPKKGFALRTTDGSSWAVFDQEDEPAQIKGPPVEYGEKETTYVTLLREWFGLLDDRARTRLEQANQRIISVGRAK